MIAMCPVVRRTGPPATQHRRKSEIQELALRFNEADPADRYQLELHVCCISIIREGRRNITMGACNSCCGTLGLRNGTQYGQHWAGCEAL
jgi:hypothetical protein